MSKSTRQAFGEALAQLGELHPEIVVLDADLAKSTKSEIFAKKFPTRFYEMGISEANMIGVAAGLSFTGQLPFLCSFGCFLTGRYDTIRLSIGYAQANVRLVGTHAGVGIGDDGHSQMGLEDVSLMRAIPTMGVFQPMDAKETQLIMDYLVTQWKGPAYLRLTRQNLPDLYPSHRPFRPTKLMEIREPILEMKTQVLCIATGSTVSEACQAAEILKEKKVSLCVWNAHCLKPFDKETLFQIIQGYQAIASIEDHTVVGGLGSCISEALASLSKHPPLIFLGIQDAFGESGAAFELYEKFGISAKQVASQILMKLGLS